MSLSRLTRDWRYLDDNCWEVIHPWEDSCLRNAPVIFCSMFPRCLKVYFPLYVATDLLLHGFNLKRLVAYTLPNVIRSTTFLSVQGSLVFNLSCVLRRILGRFYTYTSVFFPMLASSLVGILIERKERRAPLTTYMCMEAIYGLYYAFKSRGMVTPLPHGEVVLFSVAMAILCHSMEHKGKDISISILRFLLTPHFPIVNGSIVESLCHTTGLRQYPKITFLLSLAETGCWSFLLGYCGRSLSSAIVNFLKNKKFSSLLRPWSHYSNVQLGLFLGTLTVIYKFALAAFGRFLSLGKASLLAGAVAGLSMVLWKSPPIAIYAAVKAIELAYWRMAGVGWLPVMHHAGIPIYCLATAITFHLTLFEADHVSKHYWTFIRNIVGNRWCYLVLLWHYCVINAMEHKGKDISISILRFLLTPHFPIVNGSIVESLCRTTGLRQYPRITFLLSLAETGCWSFLLGYCGRSLSSALVSFLKNKKFSSLLRPWSHYSNVQLGIFLGTLTVIYKFALAVFIRFLSLGKASSLAGAVAGLSMMLWKSPPIALYAAVKAIEIAYWRMMRVGLLPVMHHAGIPIYCLATAITFHLMLFEADHVSKHYWAFIRNIAGDRFVQVNHKKLCNIGMISAKRQFSA